jgi:hypothetical protein
MFCSWPLPRSIPFFGNQAKESPSVLFGGMYSHGGFGNESDRPIRSNDHRIAVSLPGMHYHI